MTLPLILLVGLFATVSGILRLALIARSYRAARRDPSAATSFDTEEALTISIASITAIIGGVALCFIGLALRGIV